MSLFLMPGKERGVARSGFHPDGVENFHALAEAMTRLDKTPELRIRSLME